MLLPPNTIRQPRSFPYDRHHLSPQRPYRLHCPDGPLPQRRAAVARGNLSEEEGREAMALLLAVEAKKEPLPSPQESCNQARRYQRSVYDSWYLYVAERAGCEFWTADQKLYNAMKDKVSFVRWLEDYRAYPSPRPSSS